MRSNFTAYQPRAECPWTCSESTCQLSALQQTDGGEVDDILRTYFKQRASEDMERYLSAGRRFRGLTDVAITSSLVAAWEQVATDPSISSLWSQIKDLTMEIELRDVEPPIDAIQPAMNRLGEYMKRSLQQQRSVDPEAYAAAGDEFLDEMAETLEIVSSAPKH